MENVIQPVSARRSTIPIFGLVLLIIGTLIGGVIVGALLAISGRFLYLVILSPIIAGVVAGFLLSQFVKMGKVRSGLIVLLFGLFMGVVTYGTYRYGEYLIFLYDVLVEQGEPGGTETVQSIIQFVTELDPKQESFVQYVELSAEEGMTITRATSSSSGGIPLDKNLTIIYWGVEFLIITGATILMGRGQTKEPFCEETNKWLTLETVGYVGAADAPMFQSAIRNNDFGQASAFLKPNKMNPGLQVMGAWCSESSQEAQFKVLQLNGNKTSDFISTHAIPMAQFRELIRR